MNARETDTVCREETILRERGFHLVRAKDGRFVATETVPNGVPATLPHETAEAAWKATFKRVIRAH